MFAHTSLASHAPGVGWGQNVGLKDFCHILTLLLLGASVFHKHMSSFYIKIKRKSLLSLVTGSSSNYASFHNYDFALSFQVTRPNFMLI